MNWSARVRQIHRWTSVAFVAIFIVVSVMAATQEEPVEWVFYLPLLPLAVLLITGVNLFILPYTTRRRRGQHTD